MRQALGALARRRLIRTHVGAGGNAEYGGGAVAVDLGWSQTLTQHGVRVNTRVVQLWHVSLPDLAARIGSPMDRFVALDRVRTLEEGIPVSLERSRIALTGQAAPLLHGDFASLLMRPDYSTSPTGSRFCCCAGCRRAAAGARGSLLDPERFDLHMEFDPAQPVTVARGCAGFA